MTTRPNVVWIQADQLRTDALGCYGNRWTRMVTPHLDSLAEGGVRFDNCFCNSPVCAPSRHAVLTGLYPEDTGVYSNEANRPGHFNQDLFYVDQGHAAFPQVFSEHGYATANFGKHDSPIDPWDVNDPEGKGFGSGGKPVGIDEASLIKKPLSGIVLGGRNPGTVPYPAEALTQNALRWMESASQPFLVRLSYLEPHPACYPPPEFVALYGDTVFNPSLEMTGRPSEFERRNAELTQSLEMPLDDYRLFQVYYYATVAWLDTQVGIVLDFLRRTGQLESTIVYFDSDHGEGLGERGIFNKHVFAPGVQRVPRLLQWKGTIPGGQARTDVNEGLDLARTLFGLCGIDAPAQFKGRDLMSSAETDAVFSAIGSGYPGSKLHPRAGPMFDKQGGLGTWGDRGWPRRACIRTQRYRLDKNVMIDGELVGPEDEDVFLADVQADPDEINNIAGEPWAQETARALSRQLDEHVAGSFEVPARTQGLRIVAV